MSLALVVHVVLGLSWFSASLGLVGLWCLWFSLSLEILMMRTYRREPGNVVGPLEGFQAIHVDLMRAAR